MCTAFSTNWPGVTITSAKCLVIPKKKKPKWIRSFFWPKLPTIQSVFWVCCACVKFWKKADVYCCFIKAFVKTPAKQAHGFSCLLFARPSETNQSPISSWKWYITTCWGAWLSPRNGWKAQTYITHFVLRAWSFFQCQMQMCLQPNSVCGLFSGLAPNSVFWVCFMAKRKWGKLRAVSKEDRERDEKGICLHGSAVEIILRCTLGKNINKCLCLIYFFAGVMLRY